MGFLDNVRDRFTGGRSGGGRRGRDWNEHDGEYYDDGEYDNGAAYDDDYRDDYHNGYRNGYDDDGYDRPASMNRFGVDRADYYTDNHTPLVSLSDVRSQQAALSVSGRSYERGGAAEGDSPYVSSRQPARQVSPRSTSSFQSQQGDEMAFKPGLARTESNLSQLQEQRLRMETSGRATSSETADLGSGVAQYTGAGSGVPAVSPMAGIDQSALGAPVSLQDRISTGQVHQRVHRRIEYIRPATYGEAEQVSQELKQGIVVVLDLRSTRPELAKRILDFSFGVVSALDGQVDRHVDRVYVFTRNGALTESEQASIRL
ncbi:MAG TPA: hypothetical protein DEB24_00225 [Coriobacteriia bacterium]|nr:hypothetical protein [Coriobacteriia bacterium]